MPNIFTDLRVLTAHELTRMAAAIAGTYVFPTASGGAVTSNSNMAPSVAAITANTGLYVNGAPDTTGYAGGTVTVAAADTTNPRRDLIWYDGAGAIGITAGTPAANPILPTLTAGRIAIYEVYVAANDTSIDAGDLIDRRANVPVAFDLIRTQFRSNRRLVGEWTPGKAVLAAGEASVGVGFYMVPVDASDTQAALSGEPTMRFSVATAGAAQLTGAQATVSPSHSPRLLGRIQWPAASANVTTVKLGFFDDATATANGAYLRVNTTGNVFFVTRQGGLETTTDLGVLSRTTMLGYEIETADAGVTWVCRNQAGTVLATHTTNVPTAATALIFGAGGTTAVGAVLWRVSYLRVEGTFA